MDIKNIIGIIAGILTAISLIPQICKIIRQKKSGNISGIMPFVLLVGNGLWVWYGLLLSALPITLTNSFSVICDILLIYLNFHYRRKG